MMMRVRTGWHNYPRMTGVAEELGSGAGKMDWLGYITDWVSPLEAWTHGSSKGGFS